MGSMHDMVISAAAKSAIFISMFISNAIDSQPLTKKREGQPVNIQRFPFIVSVWTDKTENSGTRVYVHKGGGTIIKEDVVLTACRIVGFVDRRERTQPLNPRDLQVSAGTWIQYGAKDPHQQIRKVKKNQLHPRCDLMNAVYDLSVLTLDEPFYETDYVKTWQIFTWDAEEMQLALMRMTDFRAGCYQLLWSEFLDLDDSGPPPSNLWATLGRVKLIPEAQCRKYFCIFANSLCDYQFESHGQFCVVAENGTVPCENDIGNPLVCQGSVIGTVSFGSCNKCKPSVYVSPKIILEVLREHNPQGLSAATTQWEGKVLAANMIYLLLSMLTI